MLFTIFYTFFKIGAFTFGGGFAMIPIIREELVSKREWISDEEFMDTIAIVQASPGPIAVNTSIFLGYRLKGLVGALTALIGTVLPSFIIMILIAMYFFQYRANPILEKIFSGIRPAVVALIMSAVYQLTYKSHLGYGMLAISALTVLIIVFLNISAVYLVIAGAVLSVVYHKFIKIEEDDEEEDEDF